MDPQHQRLAEARAQLDTKALKKTIKEFYAILSPSSSPEQLQAAHATFLIGLDQLAQHLGKAERIEQVTGWEVEGYRSEVASLEHASSETRQRLQSLEARLAQAQQERARRIEYDGLARVIGKLPDRAKGDETITRLSSDIAVLQSESAEYAQTWAARKEAFGDIVGRLVGMQEAIRDEKAEQDRRRALDDADADADGDEADESAAAASAPMTASNSNAAPLDPNAKEFVPAGAMGGGGEGGEEDVEMAEGGEAAEEEEAQEQEGGEASRKGSEEREEGEMSV
ncbi:hypothetical protein JCM6882_003054 [Rhodosporidiobolus microsporus]